MSQGYHELPKHRKGLFCPVCPIPVGSLGEAMPKAVRPAWLLSLTEWDEDASLLCLQIPQSEPLAPRSTIFSADRQSDPAGPSLPASLPGSALPLIRQWFYEVNGVLQG